MSVIQTLSSSQNARPFVIITISRFAMMRWFPGKKISEIHGKPKRFGDIVVIPMYHPAAALHQPSLKATLEADFKRVPQILKDLAKVAGAEDKESKKPPSEQLSLF